jgi:hypothetical protein
MRRLAGEFNQAETTFFLESTRADRKLRSFTATVRRSSAPGTRPSERGSGWASMEILALWQPRRRSTKRLVPMFYLLSLRKSAPGFTAARDRPLCACWIRWAMWIRWRRRSGSIHAKSCLSQHRAPTTQTTDNAAPKTFCGRFSQLPPSKRTSLDSGRVTAHPSIIPERCIIA